MGTISEGFRTGLATPSANPFNIILTRYREAEARRLAEDKERKKEEFELKKALEVLDQQHENDKKLKTWESVLSGDISPTDPMAGGAISEAGAVDPAQGVLDIAGLGGFKQNPQGPAATKRRKAQLDLEEAEYKAFERTPAGATAKAEQEASGKIIQDREEAKIEQNQINSMVDAVFGRADELIPAQKTAQGAAYVGGRRMLNATGISRAMGVVGPDEEVEIGGEKKKVSESERTRAFDDFKEGTLSPLIRSLGEKGVLNNQDIERARKLAPGKGDTTNEREIKKESLREFLQSKINAYYQANPQATQGKAGGQLMQDANGNKAMVYPDGTVEEIQ